MCDMTLHPNRFQNRDYAIFVENNVHEIQFSLTSGAMHIFEKFNIGSLRLVDYFAIGTIFSATDSVCTLQVLNQEETPLLYSLVFGEGVVNDATSVVLFNAIQNFDLSHISSTACWQFVGNFFYLFATSTVLGVFVRTIFLPRGFVCCVCLTVQPNVGLLFTVAVLFLQAGLFSAYIIKTLYFGRHSTDREVALMILMAYFSYMLAELFDLSAILTVFFCGLVMSHYTWHNVTESSRITTKHAFATLSFVAEIFIFLYVGMDALDIEKWRVISDSPGTSVTVSSLLLGLILLGRAAFVFPLSFISNLTKKSSNDKINLKQQITVWWAGLMRGAVSMALAYNQFTKLGHTQLRGNAMMITSTITVVLFSTVVFGMMTKPLIRFLLPSPNCYNSSATSDQFDPSSPMLLVPLLGNCHDSESALGSQMLGTPTSFRMFLATPSHTVHHYWRKFDDAFMRPVFGGRGFVPFVPASPTDEIPHQWK
ncbi:hypothetical protein KSS87_020862 [Heliosperma pusillum]|nr:hypothetical protein KSS87_014469 [Heliosperma pusillum]KAH9618831.1 hypothetical protein KSS87_020862 [Heliosperma pusillum]